MSENVIKKTPKVCKCKASKHRIVEIDSLSTTDAINKFKMKCTGCGATWTRKEY